MRQFRTYILFLSLILHILLALILNYVIPAERLNVKRPSYVDLVENQNQNTQRLKSLKDEEKEKQFVRKTTVPERDLTKEKKKARFASEDEQYVLEEQRARINDMTANRSADGKPNARQVKIEKKGHEGTSEKHDLKLGPQTPLEAAKEKILDGKPLTNGDIKVAGLKPREAAARDAGTENPDTIPSVGSQEKGFSSVGEMMPNDIKFGDFTALNTDRHLFYSFYARMEELIRYRWVTYARTAIDGITPTALRQTGKENFVTKLEIILDSHGQLQSTNIIEASGMRSLDEAPVQAFREVGNFPNPPKEMVKDDGMIHIFYAFNVYLEPGSLRSR